MQGSKPEGAYGPFWSLQKNSSMLIATTYHQIIHFSPLCISLLKNQSINQYSHQVKFLNLSEVNSVCKRLASVCIRVGNCEEPYWPFSFNNLIFGKNTHIHHVSYFLEEILVQLRSRDRGLTNRNKQLRYFTVLLFASVIF